MQGLADRPWGLAWQQLLRDAGPKLGHGMPLLPAFGEGGIWLEAPATPAYSAKWLRNLLYRDGFDIGLVKPGLWGLIVAKQRPCHGVQSMALPER